MFVKITFHQQHHLTSKQYKTILPFSESFAALRMSAAARFFYAHLKTATDAEYFNILSGWLARQHSVINLSCI
jgi:hypothetical protein